MTPNERAEFLAWLQRQHLAELREISSHVNAVITMKKGAALRNIGLGAALVVVCPDERGAYKRGMQLVCNVVKIHKTTVEVETFDAVRFKVGADNILGTHLGGGRYGPITEQSPLPLNSPASVIQMDSRATELRVADHLRSDSPAAPRVLHHSADQWQHEGPSSVDEADGVEDDGAFESRAPDYDSLQQ